MIDRRDFDEWWGRELARMPHASTPTRGERDWAYRAFMAAGHMMSQAARTQKLVARDAQRPAAVLLRGMLKGK